MLWSQRSFSTPGGVDVKETQAKGTGNTSRTIYVAPLRHAPVVPGVFFSSETPLTSLVKSNLVVLSQLDAWLDGTGRTVSVDRIAGLCMAFCVPLICMIY